MAARKPSSGPLGPRSAKFAAGAVPLPRLALPSKRQGPLTAGAPRGSPTQIRECSGYFVGEGTTPLVKRRWPEGPEGIGNCPSRHSLEWSVARRRGGCHHPPVPKGFSHFVGRGLPDVPFHAWTGDREGRPYVDVRMYVKPGYRGRPGVPPLRESRNASAPAVPLSRT